MPRDRQAAGPCPRCGKGPVQCTHNRFVDAKVCIDSWEHRCVDCSFRETRAIRTDEEAGQPEADPTVCPFCSRRAL